jgi:hypothetical protein
VVVGALHLGAACIFVAERVLVKLAVLTGEWRPSSLAM